MGTLKKICYFQNVYRKSPPFQFYRVGMYPKMLCMFFMFPVPLKIKADRVYKRCFNMRCTLSFEKGG